MDMITDNIDIWASAIKTRSSAGRGSSKKLDLYGIKKLRELILELAVRGKLVPQDPNDEPASVLLERIAAEKARLVKEKKIKKSKPLPVVGAEEEPFELPRSWGWFRLGELIHLEMGQSPASKFYNQDGEGLPFFQGKADFGDLYPSPRYWCVQPQKYAYPNDVLLSVRAPVGPTNLSNIECCIGRGLAALRPIAGIPTRYIHCLMQGFRRRLESFATGTTFVAVSKTDIENLVVSLPPLAEQHRIVAKVDELMALCDQLEQQTEASIDAHATLVETLLTTLTNSTGAAELEQNWTRLADHFDTLFTTEQSIDQLKQTVLQLAVMGKLVPQDPNDEPAEVLLKRLVKGRNEWLNANASINAEAKTMLRKLKKLGTPKPPFLLPSSWSCVHLIQVSRLLVDCHNKTAPYVDSGIPIIRTTNIRERRFLSAGLKFVNQDTYNYWSRRCPPESGDIMFTREAPMGEALIVPKDTKWCLGQRTMLIRPLHEYVSNEYLLLALTEPHLLERASEHAVGLTVKHLRVGDVENLNIPLPPLAEQHRIVAKVDQLMALCDQLRTRLQQAQQTQLHLADALVEQALGV